MRLVRYLTEGRSRELSDREFERIIGDYDKALRAFVLDEVGIYRGVMKTSIRGNTGIVDPSKSTRKSAYTSNYYTLIMSETEKWSKYPARSKSIVASSGINKASGYADTGKLFFVLPHNNAKIAVASGEDIWNSFKHVFGNIQYPLGGFNDLLDILFRRVGIKNSPDNTLNELKNSCEVLDKEISRLEEIIGEKLSSKTSDKYGVLLNVMDYVILWSITFGKMYKGSTYDMLLRIFDPQKAGIKLVKSGQSIPNNREVWTDSKCLLIDFDEYENDELFMEYIKSFV